LEPRLPLELKMEGMYSNSGQIWQAPGGNDCLTTGIAGGIIRTNLTLTGIDGDESAAQARRQGDRAETESRVRLPATDVPSGAEG
jgi:hypothetical protein